MAPEQLRGATVDPRADIWALGVVLYEMLAGTRPFGGGTREETAMAILTTPPQPLSEHRVAVPAGVRNVVAGCLAKSRNARYSTASDVSDGLRSASRDDASGTAPTVGSVPAEVVSIAVLPFADMSPEKDQDYFCEGLAEELIDALAKLDGLRVVARTSAFQFKGQAIDIEEVARRLNVQAVLEGSVRKAGRRVRISAQLINAADGFHRWSERYDARSR